MSACRARAAAPATAFGIQRVPQHWLSSNASRAARLSPSGELMSRLVACCWEHPISLAAPARPNAPLPCLPPAAVAAPFSFTRAATFREPRNDAARRSSDINPITSRPPPYSAPSPFSDAIRCLRDAPRPADSYHLISNVPRVSEIAQISLHLTTPSFRFWTVRRPRPCNASGPSFTLQIT